MGRPDTQCPVDISEAEETHKAVNALEPELRDLIAQEYLSGVTISIRDKMKALGFNSRQTYYNRLYRAYGVLLGYFNDLAADIPLPPMRLK